MEVNVANLILPTENAKEAEVVKVLNGWLLLWEGGQDCEGFLHIEK